MTNNVPNSLKATVLKASIVDGDNQFEFVVHLGLVRTRASILQRTPELTTRFFGSTYFDGSARVDFGPHAVVINGKAPDKVITGRKLFKTLDVDPFDNHFSEIRSQLGHDGATQLQVNLAIGRLQDLVHRIQHPTHQLDFRR